MLLKGATLVGLDPPHVEPADLRIEADRIAERGRDLRGGDAVDLSGCLVLPGLVNAHTHLYSALARGMPWPSPAPRNFVEILEKVWWRLDRALDEDAVYHSAIVGAVESALSGTTLLIDHHSSPSFIAGSLDTIRRAVEAVGLRSVLCYEVTDRNGTSGRDAGLAENARFVAGPPSPLTRSMIGAHASFTLSDDSLGKLAELAAATGSSLHVHVAEDRVDVEDCAARYGTTLVERFDRHRLLISRTLFAHCVHLAPDAIHFAHTRGAWIAHNPRSNMNNAVGYAPTPALRRAALGTDGIDGDMLAEARAAYLKMRESGRADAMGATLELMAGGHRLGAALFGLPFGKLDAGGPADLVVLDYRPPTPLTTANVSGHLLFGMDRSHVRSVLVAGRWVVRDRELAQVDGRAVAAQARTAAAALWARMTSTEPKRYMSTEMEIVVRAVLIGIGATALLDLWNALLARRFGIPSLGMEMLGRWFGHFPRGRFVHDDIAEAPPIPCERFIGWSAHYAIGVTWAALLLAIWGLDWARRPTLGPAMVVGLGTLVGPFFIMQPGMGLGIAASKTRKPNAARPKSVMSHAVYGLGLYVFALLWALLIQVQR